MSVRKRNVDKGVPKEPTIMETFSKALKSGADWDDKDEFLDVLYWMRQLMGVVLGVLWGILPIKGFIGILIFLAINAIVVYLYCNSYQHVDDEEYGGLGELLKEGLMTSFATFCVLWIILYSAIHS